MRNASECLYSLYGWYLFLVSYYSFCCAIQALAKTYESMNEKWRALGYRKAIVALKKHNRAITSFEVYKWQ